MADLHDRMPVVLDEPVWDLWLVDGRAGPPLDEGELLAMLRPSDAIPLRIYPVNRYVNDVRRDGPDLIEPLAAGSAHVGPTLGLETGP
jgi:putative SOS response-associated peptidase YedK